MGVFRDPITINNVGAVGSTTNPLTGSALGMDRENQKAIKELIGTLDWESLSILDGGITPVSSEIIVDTEDETPADDLTTINLTSDGTTSLHTGMRIKIKSADPSRVITVKHLTGGGNIRTADGQDVVLSNDWSLDLKLQNGVWVEQKERGHVVVTEALGQVTEALGQVTESLGQVTESLGQVTESLGEVQVQGAASWSADGTPYPINAQVYHNGKQWLALRENSVEPVEGEDWTEFSADVISGKLDKSSVLQSLGQSTTDVVSQKVVTDAFADFGTRTGPYGLRWNQETNIYTELGATVRTQIQSKMRRCVLNSDGTVNYYLDPFDSTKKEDGTPAVLTGADGNVMVEIPKFYYKHSLNGNVHEWWIGESAVDGMQVHPYFLKDGVTEVDFAYYRAYEGIMQAGVLKSISGVTPTRSTTRAAFRTAARLNGPGWNIAHLHGINAVKVLYLLEYNNFDSQSKLGAGNHTGKDFGMLTGQSNVIGNDSSGPLNNNTWMSYRGIENFYGDIWEFIDGFNVNNRVPYVSNVEADFADAVYSGSYIAGTAMPTASNSWIQKITGDFLPTQVGGTSATYITDVCWTEAGGRLGLHGGCADGGLSGGTFALSASDAFASVAANVGAGLSFR